MLIDTHCHINFNAFKDDADTVIRNSLSEKIWMIAVGSNYKTSKRALEYANKYEKGVYAAVGLHPVHVIPSEISEEGHSFATTGETYNYDAYEKLAKFEKAVAIGETGLDYYHIDKGFDLEKVKQLQKKVFEQQLLLGAKLGLPVIIHCREAHDDLIEVLKKHKKENKDLISENKPWAVIHCFSGDEDLAWKYFGLGISISFTGLITFSAQWDTVIRKAPNDKIMIETDAPYMTPEPHRGKRNEPIMVKYIAKRIAEIKNLPVEKIEEITTNNAKSFFQI